MEHLVTRARATLFIGGPGGILPRTILGGGGGGGWG